MCRLPGHCALWTTGCHLLRLASLWMIFSLLELCNHNNGTSEQPTRLSSPLLSRVSHPVPPQMLALSSGHVRPACRVRHSLLRSSVPRKGQLARPAGQRGQWTRSLGGMDEAASVSPDEAFLTPCHPACRAVCCVPDAPCLCLIPQKWQTWSAGLGEEVCGAGWNQSVHL